jgi:hypothetical protein
MSKTLREIVQDAGKIKGWPQKIANGIQALDRLIEEEVPMVAPERPIRTRKSRLRSRRPPAPSSPNGSTARLKTARP